MTNWHHQHDAAREARRMIDDSSRETGNAACELALVNLLKPAASQTTRDLAAEVLHLTQRLDTESGRW